MRAWGSWRAAAAIAAIAVGGTSIALLGRQSGREVNTPPVVIASDSPSIAVRPVVPRAAPESATRTSPDIARVGPNQTEAAPAVAAPVALAMTGGAIAELSDRELSTLLEEIEALDAMPSEEIESGGAIEGAIPLETSR